jgi:hypothetical protein
VGAAVLADGAPHLVPIQLGQLLAADFKGAAGPIIHRQVGLELALGINHSNHRIRRILLDH